MKRFAFKMYLKPGCEKEYEKRHAAIWPELVKMIKDGGVSNYSIYWDKDTNILFGYQECSGDGNSQDTDNVDPITQKWWDMMADIISEKQVSNTSPALSQAGRADTTPLRFHYSSNRKRQDTTTKSLILAQDER